MYIHLEHGFKRRAWTVHWLVVYFHDQILPTVKTITTVKPNLRSRWRGLRRRGKFLLVLGLAFFIEWVLHQWAFIPTPSPRELKDAPFLSQCQEPLVDAPRENAAVVMLSRNKDIEDTMKTVTNFEQHFNKWFHYPIIFLNNEPWDPHFIQSMSGLSSGNMSFEVIPPDLWGFPSWIDETRAEEAMKSQEWWHIKYGGSVNYHHMCRFWSGKIQDHPALRPYRWYWRVDSDIEFICDIPYDPFVEMAKAGKKYGFAAVFRELPMTAPSLFRTIERYKVMHMLPQSRLYKAFTAASWFPMLLRRAMSWLPCRNDAGDIWNLCHFWTNFEVVDMEFLRSKEYRAYFDHLDHAGGFYFERWGDAPVRSLGAALLLNTSELHYFEDIGYVHDSRQRCPENKKHGQLPDSTLLGPSGVLNKETDSGVGCRCKCKPGMKSINLSCANKLMSALR